MSTYRQTLDYLYAQLPMFHRVGPPSFKKDLTNIIALCNALDNPEHSFKCIHIAGTNGKGSVSHLIAAFLQQCGYKTGLYISPHYRDFRERIKINGQYITKKNVRNFVANHKALFEEVKPSFFEMTVAMAFTYFREKKVDYAVIETGLGGRLDSTNILLPELCIITNISYDHQNMLGHTLPLIAAEKAGIIKSGIPVIIGQKSEETDQVFINKALSVNAPIFFAEDKVKLKVRENEGSNMIFDVSFSGGKYLEKWQSDLSGPFQPKNIITSIAAMKFLSLSDPEKFPYKNIKKSLINVKKKTNFIGRWMILGQDPLIIGDSAHNVDGIKIVVDEIKKYGHKKLHIVFGTVSDKDCDPILKLLPSEAIYYFAKADIPRGKDSEELRCEAAVAGLFGQSYKSVQKALESAKKKAKKQDMILIFGSIFVLAEVI